jgi:hypothetical protein
MSASTAVGACGRFPTGQLRAQRGHAVRIGRARENRLRSGSSALENLPAGVHLRETSWSVGAPITVRGFHDAHFIETGAVLQHRHVNARNDQHLSRVRLRARRFRA